MDNADVGIFLFLDHSFERDYLSEAALSQARDPRENPREVNMSPGSEIEYWIQNFNANHALVLVEEPIYEDLGSRISGIEALEGVHWEKSPRDDIDRAVTEAKNRCMNWAMGDMRETLWNRR